MTAPIGFCVIGAGAIAERHLQAHQQLGKIEPRWVVSQPEQAAADFAHRWNFAHSGTSIKPALADPGVQLVLISSPSPLHSDQAIQALEAGKDVIVEIPVSMTWPAAQQVAATAAKHGRRVWVCHTLRSTPALRLVRERIQTGQLHLSQIAGFMAIPRRRNQGMGGLTIRTWIDNLLWHHGCHQLDASLWVLDMPEIHRVQSIFGPPHPKFGMTLDVGVQMQTSTGLLITHSLSYNVEQPLWQLQFIGHEDVLTFNDGRLTNEQGEVLIPGPSVADLTTQNRQILHSFHTGKPCEFDLSRILPTMELLGRAQASADGSSS
jgi:2-hydroxy-4-carboxymuconate semialdehyde hemiacetal dehydrogenase